MSRYLEGRPYQKDALNLVIEVYMNTAAGEVLDLSFSSDKNKKPDLSRFTAAKYEQITKHKAGYYTLAFPVRLGMYAAGVAEAEVHDACTQLLMKMGQYFQIQDDYLDCFGDVAVTGKPGLDIVEGKCTWLVVEALKDADDRQLQILRDNYGVNDADCEKRVKAVYDELALADRFLCWEEESISDFKVQIDLLHSKYGFPKLVFKHIIARIFRRKN